MPGKQLGVRLRHLVVASHILQWFAAHLRKCHLLLPGVKMLQSVLFVSLN